MGRHSDGVLRPSIFIGWSVPLVVVRLLGGLAALGVLLALTMAAYMWVYTIWSNA